MELGLYKLRLNAIRANIQFNLFKILENGENTREIHQRKCLHLLTENEKSWQHCHTKFVFSRFTSKNIQVRKISEQIIKSQSVDFFHISSILFRNSNSN